MLVGDIFFFTFSPILPELLLDKDKADDVEDKHEGSPAVDDVAGIRRRVPLPDVKAEVDLPDGETCARSRSASLFLPLMATSLTKQKQTQGNVSKANDALSRLSTVCVCSESEANLDEEEDKEGETNLVVRVDKVATPSHAYSPNGEEKADEDEEEREQLDATVGREPLEERASVARNENAEGCKEHPADNHEDLWTGGVLAGGSTHV